MAKYNGGQIPAYQDFPLAIKCPGKPDCPRRDGQDHKGHSCIHNACDAYRQQQHMKKTDGS